MESHCAIWHSAYATVANMTTEVKVPSVDVPDADEPIALLARHTERTQDVASVNLRLVEEAGQCHIKVIATKV